MKKLQIIILCLVLSPFLKAVPLIDLMRKVNLEVDFQDDIPDSWNNVQVYPENFNAAIRIHLLHVEEVLRSRQYDYLNREQKSNRAQLLNVLHAYALAEKFPQNVQYRFQTPIFIDDFGTHCAVGYLMKLSGSADLAWQISQVNNLAYVREITVPGVAEWAQKWGFTVKELAWIQPGYPPNSILTPLAGGIQGTVYSITEYQGFLYAAGDFDSAGTFPSNNVAIYISGFAGWLWTDVDGGTNGRVRKLLEFEGDLIAAGLFSEAGSSNVSNVARYRNGAWEAMGTNIDGEVHDLLIYNDELYAFGLFELLNTKGTVRNAAKWDGEDWIPCGFTTNGVVNTAVNAPGGIWAGGNFNACNGMPCNNLVFWNGTDASFISDGVYSEIYDLEVIDNYIVAAADLKQNNHTQGVLRLENSVWSPLPGIDEMILMDSTASVKKLQNFNGRLLAAGNFSVASFMIYGKSLAIWQNWEDPPEPLTVLCDDENEYIEEIYLGSSIFLGGSFASNFNDEIQGIVQIDDEIQAINSNYSSSNDFIAYPNPANGMVHVKNYGSSRFIDILDLQGKLIKTHLLQEGHEIELPGKGSFILQTESGSTFRILNN